MKISDQTLNILKNFAGINASILVKPGSVIKTLSPQQHIMAVAEVGEDFKTPFAIYDLSNFLAAVSLMDQPDFDFSDRSVKISSGRHSIKYFFAEPSMIKAAGDKKVVLPSVDISFDVTQKQLQDVLRAASVLQVPDIAVIGSEGTAKLSATDTKNRDSNSFDLDVEVSSDADFKFIFKAENLKIIPGDYKVEICAKGIARFYNEALKLEYFIAIDSSSEYHG